MGVEDVEPPAGRVGDLDVGADAGLLAVAKPLHVVVGDVVGRVDVVRLDAQPARVHQDGQARGGDGDLADAVRVGAEVEPVVRERHPHAGERPSPAPT